MPSKSAKEALGPARVLARRVACPAGSRRCGTPGQRRGSRGFPVAVSGGATDQGAEEPGVRELFQRAAIALLEDLVCRGAEDAGPGRPEEEILNLAVRLAGIAVRRGGAPASSAPPRSCWPAECANVVGHPVQRQRAQHDARRVEDIRLGRPAGRACGRSGSGVVATMMTRSAPKASAGLMGAFCLTPPSTNHPSTAGGWPMWIGRNAIGMAADATTCGAARLTGT